jgi:NADPH2:quinone reductase
LKVAGTGGSEKGRALIKEQGADCVLDHTAPGYMEDLQAWTNGRGVDVILEMLANVNLARDLTAIAKQGRIVIIGNRGTIEINPRDAMGREAVIYGLMLFTASERELTIIHGALAAGLGNGTLRPVVGQTIPLAEAPRAHEAVMKPGLYGKIVLVP